MFSFTLLFVAFARGRGVFETLKGLVHCFLMRGRYMTTGAILLLAAATNGLPLADGS